METYMKHPTELWASNETSLSYYYVFIWTPDKVEAQRNYWQL